MTRRLTPRGEERRRQLMDYATVKFAENGYHPTSVSDIVGGLGVGKGVFYWYFASKEELLAEILREAQVDLRRAQEQAITHEDDPVRQIEVGIHATTAWSAAHPDVNKLIEFAITEERFADAIRRSREIAVRELGLLVREGIDRGVIRDLDPEVIARAILGSTAELVRAYVYEKGAPPDEVADAAVTFILDGILCGDRARR